jgi:hypothetical protein
LLFIRIGKIFATSLGTLRCKEIVYVVIIFLVHSSQGGLLFWEHGGGVGSVAEACAGQVKNLFRWGAELRGDRRGRSWVGQQAVIGGVLLCHDWWASWASRPAAYSVLLLAGLRARLEEGGQLPFFGQACKREATLELDTISSF